MDGEYQDQYRVQHHAVTQKDHRAWDLEAQFVLPLHGNHLVSQHDVGLDIDQMMYNDHIELTKPKQSEQTTKTVDAFAVRKKSR